jgi:D-3-phosphoglycerate dehydrogenase
VKLLLLDERFPVELLTGFEVVREPQDDVVAVLTMPERAVGEELLDRLPALRVVGTATVGFDHIDVEAADARGIAVVSVPDYCTQEVADHALALLYALLRGIVALDRDVARGGWNAKAAGPLRTLAELRVGIVGLGRIGGAVAGRLLALGAEVWANDVLSVGREGVRFVELDELLADTSRGLVVDDGAVIAALRRGSLGGAALDVLPREPPPLAPLAPNLIVTPHAAYYSEAAEKRAYRLAVARVREVLGA